MPTHCSCGFGCRSVRCGHQASRPGIGRCRGDRPIGPPGAPISLTARVVANVGHSASGPRVHRSSPAVRLLRHLVIAPPPRDRGSSRRGHVFDWRPRRAVLSLRELEIEIVGLSNDRVGIRADAESSGSSPTPPGAHLACRACDQDHQRAPWPPTVAHPDHHRSRPGSHDRVADRPASGPAARLNACDAYSIRAAITLTFDRTAAKDELATASQDVGPAAMPAQCEPMSLAIHHRTQAPLIAGTSVLRTLERLLGTSLTHSH